MKKLRFLAVLFLTAILASPVSAAWSVFQVEYVETFQWANGQEIIHYKISGTSDAGNSGDLLLSTALITTHNESEATSYMNKTRGGMLLAIEYVPDATDTPTTEATITFDTADGTLIFSEAVTTAAVNQVFDGKVDLDYNMPLTDFIFASTTLANGKKAVFHVWIIR